jgi:mRNA-degrading endonuclease RelE of RelBE toxin-antitoxin system
MADYQILFSKKAQKDIAQLTTTQKVKLQEILQQVLAVNP